MNADAIRLLEELGSEIDRNITDESGPPAIFIGLAIQKASAAICYSLNDVVIALRERKGE